MLLARGLGLGVQMGLELLDGGKELYDQPAVLGAQALRPQLEAFAQHAPRREQTAGLTNLAEGVGAEVEPFRTGGGLPRGHRPPEVAGPELEPLLALRPGQQRAVMAAHQASPGGGVVVALPAADELLPRAEPACQPGLREEGPLGGVEDQVNVAQAEQEHAAVELVAGRVANDEVAAQADFVGAVVEDAAGGGGVGRAGGSSEGRKTSGIQ